MPTYYCQHDVTLTLVVIEEGRWEAYPTSPSPSLSLFL